MSTLYFGALAYDDDDDSSDTNSRIENEYKLSLPLEKTEEVWSYLENRYGEQRTILKESDGFQIKLSDELFSDRYFDRCKVHLQCLYVGVHGNEINAA